MEHIVGTEGAEHGFHTGLATDAGHDGLALDLREFLGHHETDVVLRGLGLVDEHHRSRLELGHLSHHLTPDRTGRTGDEHALTLQQLFHTLQVDADFLTRQELFDRDLTQLQLTVVDFGIGIF